MLITFIYLTPTTLFELSVLKEDDAAIIASMGIFYIKQIEVKIHK